MKKTIFIILLCFIAVFAVFAVDMSPHPGDSLEMILIVSDDVIIESQAVSAPTFEDVLHLEQFNNLSEICLSANDEMIESPYYFMDSGYNADVAVSYIGYEMETIIYKTGEDVAIYCMEYG